MCDYSQFFVSKEDMLKHDGGYFKFIEFEDSTYLFWVTDIWSPSHAEVQKSVGKKAIAAGQVKLSFVHTGRVVMEDPYSSTLKLGVDEEGIERLEKYLGVRVYSRFEE